MFSNTDIETWKPEPLLKTTEQSFSHLLQILRIQWNLPPSKADTCFR